MTEKKRKTLLPLGLILLVSGFTINTFFLALGIHGYLREASRLTTIIGLLLVLVGLVQVIIRAFRKKS